MDAKVKKIIDEIIRIEGGYVNDPDDAGGETKFGITKAVARDNGYLGEMADLPESIAEVIYYRRYVERPGFDKILQIDHDLGFELIDTGVNMGPNRPGEFLQRWLNGFNSEHRYEDLFIDGLVGSVTISALIRFLDWRGDEGRRVLLRALNGIQATKYLSITESKVSQRKFLYGWILDRVKMES